jgi:hypothetical protein
MHLKRSNADRRSQLQGGILAVCIGKFRNLFIASGLSLFKKSKEK